MCLALYLQPTCAVGHNDNKRVYGALIKNESRGKGSDVSEAATQSAAVDLNADSLHGALRRR